MPRTVEGRPFLVEGVARVAGVEASPHWAHTLEENGTTPTPTQRLALAEHYTQWALAEHASVASFARFTLQLLALGAPADLVARAIDAQADEVRHARFGFGLASMLAAEPVGPTELEMHGALEEVSLAMTLRLAVREGMIGETLAALEAHAAAENTSAPYLKAGLITIAEEESRHAELAYAFAAWVLKRQPELSLVIEEEVQAWEQPPWPSRPGLAYWGILDAPARREIHQTGFADVVVPLVDQLCGRLSSSESIAATRQPVAGVSA